MDRSVDGKDSLYIIDGFMVIDFIDKNPGIDIFTVQQFIRNHMRPGHYDEPIVEKERDTLYFHDQVQASEVKLNKED